MALFSFRLPPLTPHASVPRGESRYGSRTAHLCIMKCACSHKPAGNDYFQDVVRDKGSGRCNGLEGQRYERSLGDWLRASSSAILQKVIQYLMCVIISVQPCGGLCFRMP